MLLKGRRLVFSPHVSIQVGKPAGDWHVTGGKPKYNLVWNTKKSETDVRVWWLREVSMWPSPRGSKSRQMASFWCVQLSVAGQPADTLERGQETHKCRYFFPWTVQFLSLWMPCLITGLQGTVWKQSSATWQKRTILPNDKEENITAVSSCLTSSEWQSLGTECEYTEEWRIPALHSWQLTWTWKTDLSITI